MGRGPDGGLRSMLRAKLAAPQWHWTALESGATGRGVPDAHYTTGGVSGWVECKVVSGRRLALRPEQVVWMLHETVAGGRCRVVVRQTMPAGPRRGEAVDSLWVLDGAGARQIVGAELDAASQQVLCVQNGGPRNWDWLAVGRALAG